jgi:hypothetical protein
MSIAPRKKIIWAYSYQLVPPQPADKLREVKSLLDREHHAAKAREGTWEGRLVVDERIAAILVLSDSPELDVESNKRVEHALRAVNAGFSVTVPMAVAPEAPVGPSPKD